MAAKTTASSKAMLAAKLEGLRKRLLDNGHRNPLIHIPFNNRSTGVLRFVGTNPEQIKEHLDARDTFVAKPLSSLNGPLPDEDNDTFRAAFAKAQTRDSVYIQAWSEFNDENPATEAKQKALDRALTERVRLSLGMPARPSERNPNARLHAELLGIDPSFELPKNGANGRSHKGKETTIQTLLLPERLAHIGRAIHEKGLLFEEETGVNVLHVALGILDWDPTGDANTQKLSSSPLLLAPVRTERVHSAQGFDLHIAAEGDLSLNSTLAQVLAADFGVKLPDYEAGTSVEAYFAAIQSLAPAGWVWTVRRESLTGVFPSSRLAMYKDLDPASVHVLNNPVVRDLLTSPMGEPPAFGTIYPTDDPTTEDKVPYLVLDADASQVSTLVDIADGHSMAVEGPPGTGKSQTIVNIIAAALHAGKKVLFVAEKVTALDVVHNRLSSVGLGAFVLPLQTGAGTRELAFRQLDKRLTLEDSPDNDVEKHAERHMLLTETRNRLQAHLAFLSEPVGATGWNVHQVMGRGLLTEQRLENLPRAVRNAPPTNAHKMMPDERQSLLADIESMSGRLEKAGTIPSFWWHAQTGPTRRQDAEDVAAELLETTADLLAFQERLTHGLLAAALPNDVFGPGMATLVDAIAILARPPVESQIANPNNQPAHHIAGHHEDDEALLYVKVAADAVEAALRFARDHDGVVDPEGLTSYARSLSVAAQEIGGWLKAVDAAPCWWRHNPHATLASIQGDAKRLVLFPEAILAHRRNHLPTGRALPEPNPSVLALFDRMLEDMAAGDTALLHTLRTCDITPMRTLAALPPLPHQTVAHATEQRSEKAATLGTARAEASTARSLLNAFPGRTSITSDLLERIQNEQERVQAEAQKSQHPTPNLHGQTTQIALAAIPPRLAPLFQNEAQAGMVAKNQIEDMLGWAQKALQERDGLLARAQMALESVGITPPNSQSAPAFLMAQQEELKEAAAKPESLLDRLRLMQAQKCMEEHGLRMFFEWACAPANAEHRAHLAPLAEALLDRGLVRFIEQEQPEALTLHDGLDLQKMRTAIAKLDAEMVALAPLVIKSTLLQRCHPPVGNTKGSVRDYTEMGLINNERSKTRRHVPLRDLTARAGKALLELQPCWMMSPLSVAQYLHPGMTFDLLVVDEASQMTPENAIGAIARAKQIVVVGDTKQLPPTSFFQKALDDSQGDETEQEDSESVLDMANRTFPKSRQLQWHYRSRHPDLITLSNNVVYNNGLTVFPAARADDPEMGVRLVEVHGSFKEGANEQEAASVVEYAVAHMRNDPELSLGIATMNKKQADLIGDLFEAERAKHPHVNAYIDLWQHKNGGLESFFIKNIENVQGDERDAIMISTVYGPDPETGKVYQRFGPINGPHGHRRLNVLFSRAKRRITTHTSMRPSDIDPEGKAEGVGMLRAWLEFSRNRTLPNATAGTKVIKHDPTRHFENHVAEVIQELGFETVPRVGVSGCSVDIGVKHPSWPHGYILGVECDGKVYRESTSSRDRDRLQDSVLKGLGWRLHRIWVVDWYRDQRAQRALLNEALHQALQKAIADERKAVMEREQAQRRQQAQAEEEARLAEMARMLIDESDDTPFAIEPGDYSILTRKRTTRKRTLYWMGFLEGILASGAIESDEEEAMMCEAQAVDDFFEPVVSTTISDDLQRYLDTHPTPMEGLQAYHTMLGKTVWEHNAEEWDQETDAINTFLGFCAGVICDGVVTEQEAQTLSERLRTSNVLANSIMFTQLRWSVDHILKEGPFTDEQAEDIREWLAALVTDGYALTGVAHIGGVVRNDDPISNPNDIRMEGSVFVLTGPMSIGTRAFIAEQITAKGGVFRNSMSEEVDYLVVSNTASRHWRTTHFGNKIESARLRIQKGHHMRFVNENALAQRLLQTGKP